jgi:porin
MRKILPLFAFSAGLLVLVPSAWGGDGPAPKSAPDMPPISPKEFNLDSWWNGPSMTYNWFDQGNTMNKHGVYLVTNLTQFGQGLVSGNGDHGFEYGGKFDAFLHLEGQQMDTWKGLSLDTHLEYLYGSNALLHGGMASAVNTAMLLPEASNDILTLSSLFVTQKFGDQLTVSVGRFNTVDFTALSPYDGGRGITSFWNIAFVAPLVEAKTIQPVTNGALIKFDTKHDVDLTLAVFDSQSSATTTGLPGLFDNGVSLLGDVSVITKFFNLPGKQSLTGTWSDAETNALGQLPELVLPQFFGTAATKDSTWSLNYHFEQAVYQTRDKPAESCGFFGAVGVSDGNPNPVKWDATFGFGGHSPIPTREDDRLGVAYYYLGLSSAIKDQHFFSSRLRDEQGTEIFYTAAINKWWSVTGDIQVVDPITTKNDTNVILGVSTGIKF